jgi:arylamine N-acetyltransferase
VELTGAQVERYLRILGAAREQPSAEALRRLVRAQLCRVPFENVSKLYYARQHGRHDLPCLERFLDGIEHHHFGGTCYVNNFQFFRLLRALGYEAALCGADMGSGPDVHVAIRVKMGGRELLVDVGYAAPFYDPIPLDREEVTALRFGRDTYLVHPRDTEGRTKLDHQRDGERVHGYVLKPTCRAIDHFSRAIRDSFREGATFMRSLLLVRFLDSQSVTILNRLRIDSSPEHFTLRELVTVDRVVEEIVGAFDMDEAVVRVAVDGLQELDNPYG